MLRNALFVCCFAVNALAQDAAPAAAPGAPPPPADEIRRVIDYFYNGKDRGPALLDVKACLKVDGEKNSTTKFECVEPVNGPVKVDTTVHGWTQWYLPEGSKYDDVVLQFIHEGQVRSTIDVALTSSGRTRTWRSSKLTKKGKWTLKVLRGSTELGNTVVTVE